MIWKQDFYSFNLDIYILVWAVIVSPTYKCLLFNVNDPYGLVWGLKVHSRTSDRWSLPKSKF